MRLWLNYPFNNTILVSLLEYDLQENILFLLQNVTFNE